MYFRLVSCQAWGVRPWVGKGLRFEHIVAKLADVLFQCGQSFTSEQRK